MLADINNAFVHDSDGQSFFAQAFAFALGTGQERHKLVEFPANPVGVCIAVTAFHVADDAFKRGVKVAFAPTAADVINAELFAVGAIKNHVEMFRAKLADGRFQAKAGMFCQGLQDLPRVATQGTWSPVGVSDGAFLDGELLVGDK